jgi:hypothetical protein
MKKLIAALALVSAAYVASAQAGDVGVSISIGQPGFYGQLEIGGYGQPQVLYRQPVLVEHRNWYPAPVYLRVPSYQHANWRSYCGLYGACARPVYFVRDDWYRNVYAPRYQRVHPHGNDYARNYDKHNYDRRDDHRDYDRRDYDHRDYDRRDYDHRDYGRSDNSGRH